MAINANAAINFPIAVSKTLAVGLNSSNFGSTFSPVNVNLTKVTTPLNATTLYGIFGLLLVQQIPPPVWMRIVTGMVSVIVFALGGIGNLTVLHGFLNNKHGKIRHIRNVNIFVLTVFDTLLSTAVCAQQSLKFVAGIYSCKYVYFTAWASAIQLLWLGSYLTSAVFAYSNFLQVSLNNVAYRAHETLQRTWLRVSAIGIALPLTIYGVAFVNSLVNTKVVDKTVFNITNEKCVGDNVLKRPFGTFFWGILYVLIPLSIMVVYLIKAYRRMRAQRIQQQPAIVYAGEAHIQLPRRSAGNVAGTVASDQAGNEHRQAQELERKRCAVRLSAWVVLTTLLFSALYITCLLLLLAFSTRFLRRGLVWYYRLFEGANIVCHMKSALNPYYYMTILPEFRQMALESWQSLLNLVDWAVKRLNKATASKELEGIMDNGFVYSGPVPASTTVPQKSKKPHEATRSG